MFGDHDARSVHWSDEHGQQTRFLILSQIANLNHQSVLDVGCGLGDLYDFLKKQNLEVDYTGIDIVPEFIEKAKIRFPEVNFKVQSMEDLDEQYDFVLASGVLSFKITDHKTFYFSMIEKMFAASKKGLAFNMLNNKTHIDDDTYAAYDTDEVMSFCKTLSDNVQIVIGYLPQDFTIYMYK
ncbi:MAG: hypothetical protein K0S38_1103 [Candidatus Paceibacter sp.]|nr:hypothetical protein [Candidatus Paceibacter sp.]